MGTNIIMLGPSGAGKDTQADLLVERYGFNKYALGAYFRQAIKENTPTANEIKKYVNAGKWVPTRLWSKVVKKVFEEIDPSSRNVMVGFIREKTQLEVFDQLLKDYGINLDMIIHFDLPIKDAIARLSLRRICPKCKDIYHLKFDPPEQKGLCDNDGTPLVQRDDDKPEAIKSRMEEYLDDIDAILRYYNKRGIMQNIDARPGIEEIHKEVLRLINEELNLNLSANTCK
jgi:adenylate kinase